MRRARIDLDALRSNLRLLRAAVAPARVLAVVKADAYGHGAVPVARALEAEGVDLLGVADLAEAHQLRDSGIEAPILAWLHAPDADLAAAVAAGIEIGVSTRALLEAAGEAGATVHLKVDTGLHRNGFAPEEAEAAFARAADLESAGRVRVRGLFSHLSNTSPADDDAQIAAFERLAAAARAAGLAPELLHIAATQAALERADARFDLVRLGIGLYGVAPADDLDPAALGLRPVMRLSAPVAAVRRIAAGEGMSYGYLDRVAVDSTLALVPLGYADGVPRSASGRAEVLIRGRRYRQVGRIAMDQFLVDVGDDEIAVGDEAVLWGDPDAGSWTADEWARAAGTIGYEIVTRVGPRVAREAIG